MSGSGDRKLDRSIAEILERSQDWDAASQERIRVELQAIAEGERRSWYCKLGRVCNGEPHEGYDYSHARGDQWPPPGTDWFTWLLMGGRGSGKTRTGAEYTRKMSERVGRMALIAPTGADVRDTMIEGESGLQVVCALAGLSIDYEPSKRRITFPNGAIATTFSAERPDRLRGPQHGFAWMDEPAHYDDPDGAWDMLLMGLRLGQRPHVVLTTTPLPNKFIKERRKEKDSKVVTVSTYKNLANLAPTFREKVLSRYEGTRLGLQELHGKVLEDVEGALWSAAIIAHDFDVPFADMDRIVIAIDPAGSTNKRSDATGMVVAGRMGERVYVFTDLTDKMSPHTWATTAIRTYNTYRADAIIAEKNFGGDMVEATIRGAVSDGAIPPRVIVAQAQRGKALRAEPVVGLYEQGKVTHVGRDLAELEDEMMTWIPGKGDSPNRVDALVWAITELMDLSGELETAMPQGSIQRPAAGWTAPVRRS